MLLAGLLGVMLSAGWLSDARCEGALKARVGVLRLSSSAPVFIAQDRVAG